MDTAAKGFVDLGVEAAARALEEKLKEEQTALVSVALFGQPGAGKSSLINRMVGAPVAEVGIETDKTVEKQDYVANGLRFVDLPGYGTTRFPKEGFLERFGIDALDLFLCVSSGKLHAADTELFREVVRRGKTCIFVLNKHDELWEDGCTTAELEQRKRADIHKHIGEEARIVFTSCRSGIGLDALQRAIADSLDGATRERWLRNAQAYSAEFLAAKRQACETLVLLSAGASAANALNPIPGVGVAVDLAILQKLFADVRKSYGLTEQVLERLAHSALPTVLSGRAKVVEYATTQGLLALLKRFASQKTAEQLTKYIPIVGQGIAASLGFAITYASGQAYLGHCHQLAEDILDSNLKPQPMTAAPGGRPG